MPVPPEKMRVITFIFNNYRQFRAKTLAAVKFCVIFVPESDFYV